MERREKTLLERARRGMTLRTMSEEDLLELPKIALIDIIMTRYKALEKHGVYLCKERGEE